MSPLDFQNEIERIRREYDRRSRKIPHDFYSAKKPANRFFYDRRLKAAKAVLDKSGFFPLAGKKILEIGCGEGGWLPDFENWGADPACLHGVDLDEEKIAKIKERIPKAEFRVAEASQLPWANGSFDIVIQSTLFSSVLLPELKTKIAAEMRRVLKPGGIILWYDFFWDSPGNSNVRGIRAGEIKKLFPDCEIEMRKITLAPPLTRILAPFSIPLCTALENLKWMNTHYLACIRPRHAV